MNPDTFTGPRRHIALLIDADNVACDRLRGIVAALAEHGTADIRRAYGDWSSELLKPWKTTLHALAIRPIQQFCYTSGKNATDIALVIDAMELLHTQRPDAFCIVSSDADFTPLVMHPRERGCDVYGYGERKAPQPFADACTSFTYFDQLGDRAAGMPLQDNVAEANALPAAKAPTKIDGSAPAPAPLSATEKALRQNTKLVHGLRSAVEASMKDDGWAMIGAAGNAAIRQSSIDPRAHGAKNFPALFKAVGLFDISRSDAGQTYVADKRNKRRAARPAG
ncbi:NYN domain-containing protein [Sphingomonas qilianensis]|uniref:NYN domain-containing protein n=1 Tax=Sphingomonas qilianensis TaxID=1736690 RepID=A0ABU9XRM1_9SPHN